MKKTIFISGVLAIFTMASCEKEKASQLFTEEDKKELASNVVDPETAAVLKFDQEVYDFGDLPAKAKVDHFVKFTNTGKSPLIIKKAVGSCGCTVPIWPKEPIAPGQTDSMKISFDAGSQKGRQQKTVTLTTNTVKGTEVWTFTANLPNDSTPTAANTLGIQ